VYILLCYSYTNLFSDCLIMWFFFPLFCCNCVFQFRSEHISLCLKNIVLTDMCMMHFIMNIHEQHTFNERGFKWMIVTESWLVHVALCTSISKAVGFVKLTWQWKKHSLSSDLVFSIECVVEVNPLFLLTQYNTVKLDSPSYNSRRQWNLV
jgi:hypothetical protein